MGEGLVVVIEGEERVGVRGINTSASEVQAGDFVAGALKVIAELVPAPCAMASAMNKNEVLLLNHLCHFHVSLEMEQ